MSEDDVLWEAIDRLWGWMPASEVKEIIDDDPDLAELCRHAHHRMSHEKAMVARPSLKLGEDGRP